MCSARALFCQSVKVWSRSIIQWSPTVRLQATHVSVGRMDIICEALARDKNPQAEHCTFRIRVVWRGVVWLVIGFSLVLVS